MKKHVPEVGVPSEEISMHEICMAAVGPLQMMSNAMQVVEHMGMGIVIFESDCLDLKLALTSSDYSFSSAGNLISDMKFRLQINYIEGIVVYTPRVWNRQGHELVAVGLGEVHEQHVIWTANFLLLYHLVTCRVLTKYECFI
jgi:hypothetical protein